MTEALSAKQVAIELKTDARTFRKFMRATLAKDEQPGQGNRYQIEPEQVDVLKKQFTEWNKPTKKAAAEVVEEERLDEELMVIDDEEIVDEALDPTDEEIEELDEEFDLEEI